LTALDYAHQHQVIHRDVKPDNVFIHLPRDGKPTVKLLDFGIVAVLSEDLAKISSAGFIGTLSHAAPEQLQGALPRPTFDVYAAGIVLYEMLAGRGPFGEPRSMAEWVRAHCQEPPAPLSSFCSVPDELSALVHRMLLKDPEQRPQTAVEVVSAL